MSVKPGEIVDTRSGRTSTIDRILDEAERSRFVYVGESHTSPRHHEMQAAVIAGLAKRGRDVIVGLEMFQRPVQDRLSPWSLGWWSEEQFIKEADWKGQWGIDYALYRPVFEAIRANRCRMVALNVPRDWVRAVGRAGWDALTAEQKAQLPTWTPPMPQHRSIIQAMTAGHPAMGNQADNMYDAQCLWDLAMADSAVKYLRDHPAGPRTVFVVLAGSGHVSYDASIPYRVAEYLHNPAKTSIVCIDASEPTKVSRGIADFVYASEPPPE